MNLSLSKALRISVFSLLAFAGSGLFAGWAEQRLEEMSVEEKIGQLFIMPACPLRGEDHLEDLRRALQEFHVGALILKQGEVETQLKLIEKLNTFSALPLLCTGDAEFGLGMRLKDTLSFPRNLTLGAIQDMRLIYELGKEIGRECRAAGLHLNFAPVADVNINPENPIIHMRSFGDNPEEVAKRAVQFMLGMQESGVSGCAKHFIGHGDTRVDSHKALPIIPFSRERLNSVELYPFKQLADAGVMTMMTGHLLVPELDPENPVTLSSKIVSGVLKEEIGFSGLVISDALNMKAMSLYAETDKVALGALLAGHDLLLYGDHIAPNIDEILRIQLPQAFNGIKRALEEKTLSHAQLDKHVLRVLQFKERLNLHKSEQTRSKEVTTEYARGLKRRLFRRAITMERNEGARLPFGERTRVGLIQIGGENPAISALFKAQGADLLSISNVPHAVYDALVVTFCNVNLLKPNFGLPEADLKALKKLKIPKAFILFGTPYAIPILPYSEALVIAYEEDPDAFEAACDLAYGKLTPYGRLPITLR